MNKNVFIFIIEIAILTGIALAFDLIPALHFTIWPLDSIIYLSILPIFIASFRWGLKGGLLCGFLCGMIQVVFDQVYVESIWQGLYEYGLSYTILGLAGLVAFKVQQAVMEHDNERMFNYVSLGIAIGGLGQFIVLLSTMYIFYPDLIRYGLSLWRVILALNTGYFITPLFISLIIITFLVSKQSRILVRANM